MSAGVHLHNKDDPSKLGLYGNLNETTPQKKWIAWKIPCREVAQVAQDTSLTFEPSVWSPKKLDIYKKPNP